MEPQDGRAVDEPNPNFIEPSNEFLDALGRVTLNSANLEEKLVRLYGRMLSSPYSGTVASGLSVGVLIQGCTAIQKENWHPEGDRFSAVLKRCEKLYDERNSVVHGTWISIIATGERVSFRGRRWRSTTPGRVWTIEEMLLLATQLGDAVHEIDGLIATGPQGQ